MITNSNKKDKKNALNLNFPIKMQPKGESCWVITLELMKRAKLAEIGSSRGQIFEKLKILGSKQL